VPKMSDRVSRDRNDVLVLSSAPVSVTTGTSARLVRSSGTVLYYNATELRLLKVSFKNN
jgi:hypothetical protein